uniref:Uncharacterized protein n=1 Tax=Clandestinovirus TaxID=2831644 RepID=A0A8F8KNU8_9VIRU|nr:hypothetical protein KOM_12_76 [Clandestinovirus]
MIKKTSFAKLKDSPELVEPEPHETSILVSKCPYPFNRLNGRWNNEQELLNIIDEELNKDPLSMWKGIKIKIDGFPSHVYLAGKRLRKSKVDLMPIGTIIMAPIEDE